MLFSELKTGDTFFFLGGDISHPHVIGGVRVKKLEERLVKDVQRSGHHQEPVNAQVEGDFHPTIGYIGDDQSGRYIFVDDDIKVIPIKL